ncbi:helix-turn-helix domain-containing protein [Gimesia sp.]|uniref:helix-turn-helix domain-containing protein n=1 Tax=Gimesia sp. TaxID=2024833 RepID=UPI003A8D82F8
MSKTYHSTAERSLSDQKNDESEMVLTADQVAKILKISISSLRRLTREGVVPYKRIGRSVRYPVDSLRNYVNDVNQEVNQ